MGEPRERFANRPEPSRGYRDIAISPRCNALEGRSRRECDKSDEGDVIPRDEFPRRLLAYRDARID